MAYMANYLRTRNPELAPGSVSFEQALLLGDEIGVDWHQVPLAQFRRGLEVEWEHAETVHRDWKTVAHIAVDHIEEDRYYYTKLDEAFEDVNDR